jgi:hypothetical protein
VEYSTLSKCGDASWKRVVDPPPRRRQAGLAVGGSPLSLCITSISVIAKTLANPLSGDDLCVWKNVRSVICEVAEDGQGRVKFTELVSIIDAYSNAGHQIVTARKSSKIASNGNKPAAVELPPFFIMKLI